MRTLLALRLFGLCSLGACAEIRDDAATRSDAANQDANRPTRDDGASNEDTPSPREANVPDAGRAAEPTVATAFEAPAAWQRVQGSCGVSLRAPALVATQSHGVDSCVASFEGPDCTYSADVGGFSDPLDHYGDDTTYSVEAVRVGDKSARLVTSRQRMEDRRYFVAIHIPGPIPGGSDSTSATIAAFCFSEKGRDTARSVLQTVELPRSEADWRTPLPENVSCVGDDIRPISGYRLGKTCVDGKVDVPGVCALGLRAHASFGNGPMMCFVSSTGDYYWAHLAYGEIIAGPGNIRHGQSQIMSTQLTPTEEAHCMTLMAMLQDEESNLVSGEKSYGSCEPSADAGEDQLHRSRLLLREVRPQVQPRRP